MYGPLVDFYGRRKIVLIETLTLLVTSSLTLGSTSVEQLLCGRILQGLGTGFYSVVSKLIQMTSPLIEIFEFSVLMACRFKGRASDVLTARSPLH